MSRFRNTELKSDWDSDSDLHSEKIGAKVDKLMTKLEKSGSDSEEVILLTLNKWKQISYFADFGEVKDKTSLRETGYLHIYFFSYFLFFIFNLFIYF